MLRVFCNSSLSLLMLATLLWGGCISCPKFFMFPAAAKNCCQKSGPCKRPAQTAPVKECKRIAIELQESSAFQPELTVPVQVAGISTATPLFSTSAEWLRLEAPRAAHSPPDLNTLHSTFLL